MSDSPTVAWWVDDEVARRRIAAIKAVRAAVVLSDAATVPPRPEPTLPSVPMRRPKPRVSRPSKALRTGGKRR